jgi:hypothetical protein
MTQYQQFPMWLHHPAFEAAVISDDPTRRKPIRFPPVLVHSEDQMQQHMAMGYEPGGTPNPRAFEARVAMGPVQPHAHQEYPKWVGDRIVHSEAEELALLEAAEAAERTTPRRARAAAA